MLNSVFCFVKFASIEISTTMYNPSMTQGLMKSRDPKNRMHLKTLTAPSETVFPAYKDYYKIKLSELQKNYILS